MTGTPAGGLSQCLPGSLDLQILGIHSHPEVDDLHQNEIWVWVNTYRYINTIFSGMNIHKSQL